VVVHQLLTQKVRSLQRQILDSVVYHSPGIGLDKRAEFFVQKFKESIPPNSRILDIGGGWGFYQEPLERLGHSVLVLDVVRPRLQKAVLLLYDGQKFPLDDESFDVSLVITALHHIEDPELILQEAKRVTRSKIIVVEDVFHHGLGRLWTQWRDQILNFEFVGHPCNFKTQAEWNTVFNRQGLRVDDYKEVYTWLCGMRILNGIFVLSKET